MFEEPLTPLDPDRNWDVFFTRYEEAIVLLEEPNAGGFSVLYPRGLTSRNRPWVEAGIVRQILCLNWALFELGVSTQAAQAWQDIHGLKAFRADKTWRHLMKAFVVEHGIKMSWES